MEFEAKLYFNYLVKEILSPVFKEYGYKKSGNKWTKTNGNVFIQLKIIKSVYNNSRVIDFYFEIGLCPINILDIPVIIYGKTRNWEWSTESYVCRQIQFLPKKRTDYKVASKLNLDEWYSIYRESELDKLVNEELKVDLFQFILPILEKIKDEKQVEQILKHDAETNGFWDIDDVI